MVFIKVIIYLIKFKNGAYVIRLHEYADIDCTFIGLYCMWMIIL